MLMSSFCCFGEKKMGQSGSAPVPGQIVETTSGKIRGRLYTIDEDRVVEGFLGIPYAEPPIGELRFQKPIPKQKWKHTLDCFHFGPRCPQADEYFSGYLNIVGKDEAKCLTLNIFAPQWESKEFPSGHPVMIWIHGGGFQMHSSSNYGDRTLARNLCAKDLLVVSINYRLGLFGFFTTGDEACRGNMGLWDQTLALEWVRDNIGKFGGDPNNVTVFGQSAGGASSDLLSLSPHSRDLFHKVIPMAGCGECDFAIRSSDEQTQISKDFAKFLGYKPHEEEGNEEMLEWLRCQYAELLELGLSGKKGFGKPGRLLFTPNIDGEFFPKSIEELRKEAPRKPRMTGVTQHEGLFFVGLTGLNKTYEGMQRYLERSITDDSYEGAQKLREQTLEFYFSDVNTKDKKEVIKKIVQIWGDREINYGIWEMARKEAELGSKVYLYQFNYFNPDGFGLLKWILPFLGATHCSELRYILGKGVISKFQPNANDHKMIKIMTDFFSNFAKYGDPNGKTEKCLWEPHDHTKPNRHLTITLEPSMQDSFIENRMELWSKVFRARL
ncbi:unnamed protein product, partial [Mesorhabditis belari]|uniref:Carboxylic ester hydrolase n=1 Tax=Mesorhabditis belari TaxID=2138241 RepID=A0AAF3EYZ5_9BILA